MTKLTAPYNFVPLNSSIYIPDWADKVSQDIPFEDGEDGWIEVDWENVSPLIIRDQTAKDDKGALFSMNVESDGKRRYFIPGSSLKGMLRATLEILSFGRMEQYNNRFFGHREFDTMQSGGKLYQKEMQNVKWGWLSKEDEKYYLSPCKDEVKKVEKGTLLRKYHGYDSKVSQWERNEFISKKAGWFPELEKGYRLYCTGQMHNKKHECLIPTITDGSISLSDEVVKKFLTVHEPTPDFEKFVELLDKGERIPVSYIKKDGKILTLGLSRMLRLPYKNDVKTLVEEEQKPTEGHDLCETIFGYTTPKKSLRGRVQVGNAFCTELIADDDERVLGEVKGVLGEPKPSFYPLYLKQSGSSYKTYNDANAIAGRKLYRVHGGSTTMQLPRNEDNPNVETKFRPLKEGLTFTMRINLHNLRPIETGALLSAITLHQSGAWHNIGAAKSFGYGKIKYKDIRLKGLSYDIDYYLKAFEKEMNEKLEEDWIQSPQVKQLVNILSEHNNDEELKLMTLEQHGEVSKNDNFQRLEETDNKFFLNLIYTKKYAKAKNLLAKAKNKYCETETKTTEAIDLRGQKAYDKATTAYSEAITTCDEAITAYDGTITAYDEAITAYNALITNAQQKIDNDPEGQRNLKELEEVKQELNELQKEKNNLQNGLNETRRVLKNAEGLATSLEKKFDNGRYKRDTIKKAVDIAREWPGKQTPRREELTDEEKDALLSTLQRLKATPNRDDRRTWAKRDDRIWEKITGLIGEDRMKKLWEEN